MSTNATSNKASTALAEVDLAVTDELSEHRHSWPIEAMGKVSELGDQPQLRLISGLFVAAGLVGRKPRLVRAGVRMLIAHELATVAKNFVKRRVDRVRPRSADTADEATPRPGGNTGKEVTSFPSGHTAGSLAVAQAFAREFPEYRTAARAAAGFVAIVQIPRCAHYPTDVGAGALVGGATEAALAQLWPAPAPPAASRLSAPPPLPPRA